MRFRLSGYGRIVGGGFAKTTNAETLEDNKSVRTNYDMVSSVRMSTLPSFSKHLKYIGSVGSKKLHVIYVCTYGCLRATSNGNQRNLKVQGIN